MKKQNEYDVIIVGSGTCGATIARELTKHNKKVLMLERGGNRPLSDSFFKTMAITDMVKLGDKLMTMRALTTGGSTALYLAVADLPPLDVFNSLGIDLTQELEEARKEVPIARLPNELISPQTLRLHEGALQLGYEGEIKTMFIEPSKCTTGYSYDAKWKARTFVQEAIDNGTTLINNAMVTKVLVENNKAVGVEYKIKKKQVKVYGEKVILAAGAAASPIILRDSGIKEVEKNGFYMDPNCGLFGTIPGLKAKNNFMGCWALQLDDDVQIGDLNATKSFYRVMMLASGKPERLFSFSKSIGVGVKVKDEPGGELLENNRYHKKLTEEDYSKLKKGEEVAEEILKSAGAKNIFRSSYGATNLGGTISIKKHLDEKLQTAFDNLFVCDGSIIPGDVRISPNLTLICLAKYLAKHLLSPQLAAVTEAEN